MLFPVKTNLALEALEEAKATCVLSLFFVSCEEKDHFLVVSIGKLGFDSRSFCECSHCMQGFVILFLKVIRERACLR